MSDATLDDLIQTLLSHSWEVEAAFFVFYWIIYLSSRRFTGLFIPSYNSLSIAKKTEWDMHASSTVNALFITYGACRTLYDEPSAWFYSPFHHTSPASHYYFSAILGFFLYDTVLVLMKKELFSLPLVVHHVLGLWLFGLAALCGVNHYNMLLFAATEANIPFVNLRWFLATCNTQDGALYYANGFTMAVSFLVIRAIVVPILAGYTITVQHHLFMQLSASIRYSLYTGFTTILIVNAYWTFLIWSGLIKVMRGSHWFGIFPSKQA